MVATPTTDTQPQPLEERVARIEGELVGITKRLDDMNSRLNILTAGIITQTLVIAGLIVAVLLRT